MRLNGLRRMAGASLLCVAAWLHGAYEFAGTVWLDYVDDNGNLVAAAVSFFVFLSLIPMLVLGIAIGGYLLGSPARAEDIVLSLVRSGAPELATAGWLDAVRAAVNEVVAGRRLATGFGILTLLWIGTTLFGCLEQAINVAWGLGQRQFVRQRVLALVTLFLMWLLLGVSFVITTALTAIRWNEIVIFGVSPSQWPWVVTLVGYVVPVALSVVTFSLLYHLMPNARVAWKVAFAGGAFAGVLWELGKYVFSYYLSSFANYSAVYGSLAGIIVLLIWIYFSSVITIMGAEVASVYAGRRELRERGVVGIMSKVVVRRAVREDVGEIARIYNYAILNSTATFDVEPKSLEDRMEWFEGHGDDYPLIVASVEGKVAGWASIRPFGTRVAYRFTVENAVYVDCDCQGMGVGSALMGRLVELAVECDYHSIMALIVGGNEASVKLHVRHGFELVGNMREVGWKFDQWLDVLLYERILGKGGVGG